MKKVITFLAFLVLTSCAPNPAKDLERTKYIENNFPLLEKYEVRSFISSDWCDSLTYKRGHFADEACSRGYPTDAQGFDSDAKTVFDEVKSVMRKVNIINITNIKYEEGKIVAGEFNYESGTFYDRFRYYYRPGHAVATSTQPYCEGEIWNTPIDDDWFFECEDWN